jgi:hypothetical protein
MFAQLIPHDLHPQRVKLRTGRTPFRREQRQTARSLTHCSLMDHSLVTPWEAPLAGHSLVTLWDICRRVIFKSPKVHAQQQLWPYSTSSNMPVHAWPVKHSWRST